MTKIWGLANFFVISVTGSLICYLDSQFNYLHFELLIDTVARKLTELWQFQNLTYFLTSWPSYLTYILVQRTCRNHGLVLACDQVWWWLTESFLWFCEISVQTNRQTNTTNEHTCQNFFVISVTGSLICYLDSQFNYLHFELLIDTVARKLTELWQFQNLTYFLTSWPSYLTYILVQRTCRNHGLVLACDQVWWWLTESFLWFCEISVQTNRQMKERSESADMPKFNKCKLENSQTLINS